MLKFIRPRNVLITTGLGFLLTGVIFQIDSIQLAKDTFPKELLTHEGLRIAELMQEGLGTHLMMGSTMELTVLLICYHYNNKSCNELHASSKLVGVCYMLLARCCHKRMKNKYYNS